MLVRLSRRCQRAVRTAASTRPCLDDSLASAMHVFEKAGVRSPEEESVDVPYARPEPLGAVPGVQAVAFKPPKLADLRLGFVGWGAMAQAVSLGVIRQGLTDAAQVQVFDVVPEMLARARSEGFGIADSNADLVRWADIVIVATKPQVADAVVQEIAPAWAADKLLVSICAGVTLQTFERQLDSPQAKVIRVMPNTPCLVGQAATAYAGNAHCAPWELDIVHGIFAAVGRATHRVPEYLLNTVTGVSGSGPAYVYMLIQALSDAGVHGGLPRTTALSLAAQTVIGAAQMVQQSGEHPMVLKEAVTSPAGTTIAGVRVLEKMNFNSAVIEAVEAARVRSEELAREPDFLFQRGSKL